MQVKKILRAIVGIPKTVLFNFYYLPFKQAIRFPLIVLSGIEIKSMGKRASVKVENANCRIVIGGNGSFALSSRRRTYWEIADGAQVVFKGSAKISKGTQIVANRGGYIEFGDNFYCNSNCIINSADEICFGADCLLGWDVTIIDGDGHSIIDSNGKDKLKQKKIQIGDHVWIASNCMILKGSTIGDDCVIAANASVTKSIEGDNLLIGGTNQILKEGISWKL